LREASEEEKKITLRKDLERKKREARNSKTSTIMALSETPTLLVIRRFGVSVVLFAYVAL